MKDFIRVILLLALAMILWFGVDIMENFGYNVHRSTYCFEVTQTDGTISYITAGRVELTKGNLVCYHHFARETEGGFIVRNVESYSPITCKDTP